MQENDLDGSCKEYLACLFVKTYDNGSYRVLNTILYNENIMGKYSYPENMEEAIKIPGKYKVVAVELVRLLPGRVQESLS